MKLTKQTLFLLGLNFILLVGAIFLLMKVNIDTIQSYQFESSGLDVEQIDKTRRQKKEVDFSIILNKALFHQNRKKIERVVREEPRPVRVTTIPLNRFLLKGVVYTDDAQNTAYVHDVNSGKEYILKVNDQFEGWQVKEIFKDYIKVDQGGQPDRLNILNNELHE